MYKKMLAETVYGSELYGCSVPESDMDFKSVSMYPLRDHLLNKVPKSNKSVTTITGIKYEFEDIDLVNFCSMLKRNIPMAMEIYFSHDLTYYSNVFQKLLDLNLRFNNVYGMLGYLNQMIKDSENLIPKKLYHAVRMGNQAIDLLLYNRIYFNQGALYSEIRKGRYDPKEVKEFLTKQLAFIEKRLDKAKVIDNSDVIDKYLFEVYNV